jgi:two-component system response regulator DesR
VIRVLIISELGLLRGALTAILAKEPDIEVVGELGPHCDVVSAARVSRPDVTVIDLDLMDGHALDTAERLARELPDTAVVALTEQQTPGVLRAALAARVRGFACKGQPPAELTELIRQVAGGARVIDPATALAALATAENPLTVREQEVLRLVAEGLSNKVIASRLYLTNGTVRNHLSTILRKIGAKNRLQAVRAAREAGWL